MYLCIKKEQNYNFLSLFHYFENYSSEMSCPVSLFSSLLNLLFVWSGLHLPVETLEIEQLEFFLDNIAQLMNCACALSSTIIHIICMIVFLSCFFKSWDLWNFIQHKYMWMYENYMHSTFELLCSHFSLTTFAIVCATRIY